jgi:hypothetical protein
MTIRKYLKDKCPFDYRGDLVVSGWIGLVSPGLALPGWTIYPIKNKINLDKCHLI